MSRLPARRQTCPARAAHTHFANSPWRQKHSCFSLLRVAQSSAKWHPRNLVPCAISCPALSRALRILCPAHFVPYAFRALRYLVPCAISCPAHLVPCAFRSLRNLVPCAFRALRISGPAQSGVMHGWGRAWVRNAACLRAGTLGLHARPFGALARTYRLKQRFCSRSFFGAHQVTRGMGWRWALPRPARGAAPGPCQGN